MIEPIYDRLLERVESDLAAARAAIAANDAGSMLLNTASASCTLKEVTARMIGGECAAAPVERFASHEAIQAQQAAAWDAAQPDPRKDA